jgi:glycosyltransferase involved in cell wall biosynthesis
VARLWLSAFAVSLNNPTFPALAAHGKFLRRGDDKFFFKGVRLSDIGEQLDFSRKLALRDRFDKLKNGHTTALIVPAEAADAVLGLAAQAGLYALAEFTVGPADLMSRANFRLALDRVAHVAAGLRGHRALAGFLIDCPIAADELRNYGVNRVRRRMRELMRAARQYHPDKLAAIKHRPDTCALSLLEEDMLYAVLDTLAPDELREFIVRLHNLAESRPTIIEFADGQPNQDDLIAYAFGLGAAGVVASPLAPPGSTGIRMLAAGEIPPFVNLNGSCPPASSHEPQVSVVVCAYNAERTLRPCLESLRKLEYPNYEVIVVDDGSRDRTAEIAAEFPEFRLIRQPNRGLSTARNVGLHAARGALVAYTDSDCVADPHWLTLMVHTIAERRLDGCGGPNYAPHEDGWVAACVAASPGAPCHVLTGTDHAEHLAGCNMVFTRAALMAIGGFDAQFTAAGDDVDICWRLLDNGYRLGFCPSAFVWHFRRNTVRAYFGQQRGYGRAEAMLYVKYPERFNALGQIRWRGVIPGFARTMPGGSRTRISWTRAPGFQTVYERPLSILKVLPLSLEWNLFSGLVLISMLLDGCWIAALIALGALSLGPLWALYYGWRAPLERCHRGFLARLFVAALAYTGPLIRTLARYRHSAAMAKRPFGEAPPRQRPRTNWRERALRLAYWNERYTTRDMLLQRLAAAFAKRGLPAVADNGWNDFDLAVRPSPLILLQLKTADEEHEGTRLKNHVAVRLRLSRLGRIALTIAAICALGTAAAGISSAALAIGAIASVLSVLALSEFVEAARLGYRTVEDCASQLRLIPLGRPTRAVRQKKSKDAPVPEVANIGDGQEFVQPAGR